MIAPIRDLVPRCQMCGAGNVVARSILLERNPGTYSHWFECRVCGYSSPGRLTQDEASNDVRWVDFGTEVQS